MNNRPSPMTIAVFLALLLLSRVASLAAPLGTSFTYDGSLTDGNAPANGSYDLQFTLYDASSGGSVVGGPVTDAAVPISNGLFTIVLDFGSSAFTGDARWLEVGVRTNAASAFTTLAPRQTVQATPYTLHSRTAGSLQATNIIGEIASAQLGGIYSNGVSFLSSTNVFNGYGAGLTLLNASALASGTVPGARLSGTYGNVVTFNNGANNFSGNFTGTFSGDGSGLLNLNASALAGGTVPGARLSGTYGNAVTFNNSANQFTGAFIGNLNGNSTTANTAVNFTGMLNGDVTGTQGATVISSISGNPAFSGNPVFSGTITLQEGPSGATHWDISVGSGIGDQGRVFTDALRFASGGQIWLALLPNGTLASLGHIATLGDINANGSIDAIGNISAGGSLQVSGTKNFVQVHPTDPTKEIVYTCLEGPEAGTYVRGAAEMVNGQAVIKLPKDFGLVTSTEGLTVQLTPRGAWLQLYVTAATVGQVTVREAEGRSGHFDYLVHGVRKGFENHETIRERHVAGARK